MMEEELTWILSPRRTLLHSSTPLAPRALSLRFTSTRSNFFKLEQIMFSVRRASSSGRPAMMSLTSAMVTPSRDSKYSAIFVAAPLSKLLLLNRDGADQLLCSNDKDSARYKGTMQLIITDTPNRSLLGEVKLSSALFSLTSSLPPLSSIIKDAIVSGKR